jgi:ABC-type branched-subunit amino acid transport system permease subunit
VVAVLAIGLVLTFRASNVLNFAHAAMGMYVAYAYFTMRNFDVHTRELGGDVVLPILGLPARVHVIDRPTVLTALTVAVLCAVVLGAAVYALVFRPLRHAPPLARVVASLGVFLYLQSVMSLRVSQSGGGAAALRLDSLLPTGAVRVGDAAIPAYAFVLAGIAVAFTVVLVVVFRSTRFGLATRAAAEHETGLTLMGRSPDRLGFANWILASVSAGLAIILFAGVSGRLDPVETSLLVVPALAAALLGGLTNFGVTLVSGLAISMAAGALGTFQARADWLGDWLPRGGLASALPVIVILVAISVRGARLPMRESLVEGRPPAAPMPYRPVLTTVVLAAIALIALFTLDDLWRLAIVVSILAAIIGLSSVVLTGYLGQISLAQYAFTGLAAFTTAKLAIEGVPFPWAPVLAVAVSVGVGLLVGLPALRVRGMTLAVATLGAAVAVEQLVFSSPELNGLTGVPRPHLFGLDLGFLGHGRDNFRPEFGVLVLAALVVCALGVANLRRSPTGLRWLAVRSNERAAAASGIDVRGAKLGAFAMSSALAGVGGALLAYELPALSPQQFMVVAGLAVLALCYLGGIATITGALVAGVLASGGVLTQLQGGTTGSTSATQFAVSGVVLVAVVIFAPDGLALVATHGLHRVRDRTRWSRARSWPDRAEPGSVAVAPASGTEPT